MEKVQKTREFLQQQIKKYPKMQLQDLFKFLYQSAFGCEHLVSSVEDAVASIQKEATLLSDGDWCEPELLDGDYCRVPLSYLKRGLSAETLGKLFFFSAKTEEEGKKNLQTKLQIAEAMIMEHLLPFSKEKFISAKNHWEANGFPPIHHSAEYREAYHPSYRLMQTKFLPLLPVLTDIDRRLETETVTVAIEGGSASGKTTCSEFLEQLYDCTVFHMDDFFLQKHQRTPERYREIGGNIDRERFLAEVLQPLQHRKPILLRKFDCSSMTLTDCGYVTTKKLCVVEGAYSMHPEFSQYYDVSLFLDVPANIRKERILKRNGKEMAQQFFSLWMPMENIYFEKTNCKARCDYTIKTV